jgi:hypothetical protein
MENTNEEQTNSPRGQEINASFKGNKDKYPNGKEELDKDLIKKSEEFEDNDGQVVKSSDPESQEWHAREDQNDINQ